MKAQRSDSLWPLSFDQESGDTGLGLLPDKFSNHKYFPWHKVKQARTSGPTGVIPEMKAQRSGFFGYFLLMKKVTIVGAALRAEQKIDRSAALQKSVPQR